VNAGTFVGANKKKAWEFSIGRKVKPTEEVSRSMSLLLAQLLSLSENRGC